MTSRVSHRAIDATGYVGDGNQALHDDGTWKIPGGGSGVVETIVAGTGIAVDSTDPANPVVSATGGGGGGGSSIRNVDDPADASWGTASAYDLEFDTDDDTGALPAGWTWVNQGTSAYSQQFGAGIVVAQPAAGVDGGQRLVVRSLPTESTWTATAKLSFAGALVSGTRGPCLVLYDSTTGKFTEIGPNTTSLQVECNKWTTTGSFNSAFGTNAQYGVTARGYYLRVRRNSSTSWDFSVSNDGVSWAVRAAAANVGSYMTPDKIGVLIGAGNNNVRNGAIHWLRVR